MADDFLSPDHIEEQIEQARRAQPSQHQETPDERFIRELSRLYEHERNLDTQSLDRAWNRIAVPAGSEHINDIPLDRSFTKSLQV